MAYVSFHDREFTNSDSKYKLQIVARWRVFFFVFLVLLQLFFYSEILKFFDSSIAEWNNNKFDGVEWFVGEKYSTLFALPNICPLKPDVLFSSFFFSYFNLELICTQTNLRHMWNEETVCKNDI